jgi:enoyl-CoA hydratase
MVEIVISAPGKNALSTQSMEELLTKLELAEGRPVLLTGAGDAFSAGLNLKEVASLDRAGMGRFLDLLVRLMETWFAYPGPTVAFVNGHAIAGGCILALTCDYRVALTDPKIRVGINEVAIGLRFPPSIMALLRRRVSPQHLETLVLGAGLHSPAEAARLGLVDETAENGRTRAEQALTGLAAHPRAAYAAAKKDLRASLAPSPAENARFVEEGLPTWTSAELKDRIAKQLAR